MKVAWNNFNGGGATVTTSPVKNELKRSYARDNSKIGESAKSTSCSSTPKNCSLHSSPTGGLNKRRRKGVAWNRTERARGRSHLVRRISFNKEMS